MPEPPAPPRLSLLLLWVVMGVAPPPTAGFPQPWLRALTFDPPEPDWDLLLPSISLQDWNIQMRPAAGGGAPRSPGTSLEGAWPEGAWPAGVGKRNLVVADDAAFRERSKLLTSMERQKWLNSYMQKLLVVDS